MNAIAVAKRLLSASDGYQPPPPGNSWEEWNSPTKKPEAEQLIEEQCAQQPNAKFMDVVRQQLLIKKD